MQWLGQATVRFGPAIERRELRRSEGTGGREREGKKEEEAKVAKKLDLIT